MSKLDEADVGKLIKDLGNNFGGNNEDQMRAVQLLKGLATSDDPKANEFMKALDKATTQISKDMSEKKEERKEIEVPESFKIPGTDVILKEGQKILVFEGNEFSSGFLRQTADDYAMSLDMVKQIAKRVNYDSEKFYAELEKFISDRAK